MVRLIMAIDFIPDMIVMIGVNKHLTVVLMFAITTYIAALSKEFSWIIF